MDRYRFIKSLAKNAGVNESYARLFAEIFLRKVYELIQPGDGIKLNDIGTAYYARAGVNRIAADKNDMLVDVIVFDNVESESRDKPVIFTVPAVSEVKQNPVDKFFSLSPSKPVVQNSNSSQAVVINSPTGGELESLLNSKTEKLLAGHQVIKNYVDPGLVINQTDETTSKLKTDFEDSFLDEELDSFLLNDIKDEELLKELESIKWELEDETTDKFSENRLLSEDHDNEAEKSLPTEEDILNKQEQENPFLRTVEEQIEAKDLVEDSEDLKDYDDQSSNEEPLTGSTEYERVKSFSSEFGNENKINDDEESDPFQAAIDKVTRELEQDDKTELNIVDKFNSNEKNENDFIEVIPKSTVINSNIINVVEDEESIPDKEPVEDNNIDPEEFHRNALKEAANFVKGRSSSDFSKEKKRSMVSLLIIIFILLILSASIYIYLKFIKAPETSYRGANGGGNISQTSLVEVIERNYELPVTYPYPESKRYSFLHYNGIDSVVFTGISHLSNSDSLNTSSENVNTGQIVNQLNKPEVVRVKSNIYQYGKSFVVQIASFKSRIIAENEALKHNRKGLQSYIEEVEIPGRGVWFRLRIGDFLTINDAENFASKLK